MFPPAYILDKLRINDAITLRTSLTIEMTDLVLCPLLEIIIDKLSSPLLEKLHDLCNLKENIRKLKFSLPLVLAFVDDATKRQKTEKAIEIWLSELQDVAYESEDLLDELTSEIMQCENSSSIARQLQRMLLPFKPSRRLFDLAHDVQEKLQLLEETIKWGFFLDLREGNVDRRTENVGLRNKETGSFINKSVIYGRKKDKKRIVELLLLGCDELASVDVPVVSIVGIGGLGKTTLARLIYNDEKVVQYFDLKIWIHVSQSFDARTVAEAMVKAATKMGLDFLEMDLLQAKLQESICAKRFLLVLDDIWNEDKKEWDELGDILKTGAEGSKVLITTRSDKVASIMSTHDLSYRLKGLHEDEMFDLFKKQAFDKGEEEKYHKLTEIGKFIIKKCGGVPLAAKTLGSHLRLKRDEKDWLYMLESDLWNLKQYQSDILPALRLSYFHLPLHLKRCFAFCSLFPKNYEIKKDKLIHIWIAEGLIIPLEQNRVMEDVGEEYFIELLYLSFFQEVEDCADGCIYKMHDLIQDLARSVGGKEFAIVDDNLFPKNDILRTRHASVDSKFDSTSFPQDLFYAKHLRTLIFLHPGGNSEELSSFILPSFVYLRFLDLSGCSIKTFDEKISVLICLRYLDLTNTLIERLPQTICNLYHLQTLSLSGCCSLLELPLGIGRLTNLRHLNITGCDRLTHIPPGIGKLVHLQTLPTYIVSKRKGESIVELGSLNLRGDLHVKCLENVKDVREAREAKLRDKKYLQSLMLTWGESDENRLREVEDILEGFSPHPNLRKLFIKGYPGLKFPSRFLPNNIVVLVLINCIRSENMPILGHLPFLQNLCLQGMRSIVCISEEFYGNNEVVPFPSLRELTLKEFPNLVEWSNNIGEKEAFPLLTRLTIDTSPKLIKTPIFPSVHHLELRNCHPEILISIENITSLSSLILNSFKGLSDLPSKLLANNKNVVSLEISSCQNLFSLPLEIGGLQSLKSLIISHCERLTIFPLSFQCLRALEFLEINGCHGITIFLEDSMKGLSSLRTLFIENCNHLSSLSGGLRFLTSLERVSFMSCPKLSLDPLLDPFLLDCLPNLTKLQSLSIYSCPELFYLPEWLQYSYALQSFIVHSCPNLTQFPEWFGNFSSLRSLTIKDCENLISLPDSLHLFAELQHLSIQDCPVLEGVCKKKGRTWKSIAHVPHIYIGSMKIEKQLC